MQTAGAGPGRWGCNRGGIGRCTGGCVAQREQAPGSSISTALHLSAKGFPASMPCRVLTAGKHRHPSCLGWLADHLAQGEADGDVRQLHPGASSISHTGPFLPRAPAGRPTTTCSGMTTGSRRTSCRSSRTSSATPTCAAPALSPSLPQPITPGWWRSGHGTTSWIRSTTGEGHSCGPGRAEIGVGGGP